MIEILLMPLGPLQTNCYLVACEETKQAVIIDPAWDGQRIAQEAGKRGFTISHILLTHSHFDHVGGLAELKKETDAPIFIHKDAILMLRHAPQTASMWGLQLPEPPEADKTLEEGDTVSVGNLQFEVLYTPGHAPGHVSFYLQEHDACFDGDVLFQQSIGRTDLPGGNHEVLMHTIRDKLLTLPDETRIFSGHGNPTTIGDEKRLNPFLQ